MSIARGVLSGLLKEGLDQKEKRDEFYECFHVWKNEN